MKITAAERSTTLAVHNPGTADARSSFEALSPEFASRYGGHNARWVNAVSASAFGSEAIATVLPYNTWDRHWPSLGLGGDAIAIGREGWIYPQRYKDSTQSVALLSPQNAITGMFKTLGIEAKLSDPGHIAKQMLEHMGGPWGLHFLANADVLRLLNNMAGATVRKTNEAGSVEQTYERRSARLKEWQDTLAKKRRGSFRDPKLEDYTKRNVIRLGLETTCPHCQGGNWHGLDTVDYKVTCERCLKPYEFPQAQIRAHNENWKYRVIGPFSVPDYGRGSYSSLLTLRVLGSLGTSHGRQMTFSTSMELAFDGVKCEADFVALHRRDHMGELGDPVLVIGETKSFGKGDLIKATDLTKLKKIGKKLPDAVIVISVMRDEFTPSEKKLLKPFVEWGRRANERGLPTNPVVLLTGHELFMDHMVSSTWKALSAPHVNFADYEHTRNLHNLAQATQAIHLGLPSFYESQAAKWKAKAQLKAKRAASKKSGTP
jgi:hypothetical protein